MTALETEPPLLKQMVELAWLGSTELPQNDALEFEQYGAGRPVRIAMREIDPTEHYLIGSKDVGFHVTHVPPHLRTLQIPQVGRPRYDFMASDEAPRPLGYYTHVYHPRRWALARVGPHLTPLDDRTHPFGWMSNNLWFHDSYVFRDRCR